ncbi:hypothetical protein HMPREF9318_02049 [Streptococcus urinalis FB127-CNA-2]|uniref:Uncharacterized protein n=1 Tax=Streptococcus urinalis 2285-97 TaxID=764291 RepID=G5KCI8_9STRE|nr:hypothetical protein [Streptococcus urinalis]EHJ57029.1 hypothetical protein STRUR_1727 [Streptococcus urinalis 2285-97]EKS17172.1 hypothetical protein HMPREF9318_02049 [Streptococcus urinalis FB127-CNA-2]VEF32578.1 membrane protein [Streptococcus urinalis]
MAIVLIVLAVISFTIVPTSKPVTNLNEQTVESLEKTKVTALKLSAASAVASTAITLIPGDVGQPIAENLADISDYLLIVVASIWLQKFLIGLTGIMAFKYLIPSALLLFIIFLFKPAHIFKQLAVKLALFSVLLFGIVPASVKLSNAIENQYQTSIQRTVDKADSEAGNITKSKNKSTSYWEKLKKKVTSTSVSLSKKFETILSRMIDAVAVLIVTTCLIPIFVLLSFIWFINIIFNLNVNPNLKQFSMVGKGIRGLKHKRHLSH